MTIAECWMNESSKQKKIENLELNQKTNKQIKRIYAFILLLWRETLNKGLFCVTAFFGVHPLIFWCSFLFMLQKWKIFDICWEGNIITKLLKLWSKCLRVTQWIYWATVMTNFRELRIYARKLVATGKKSEQIK